MSEPLNGVCDICGKRYSVCKTCQTVKTFKPWRTITDTLEHYKIFIALSEYTRTKNKEEAKEQLSHCDLSDLESFPDRIKNVIKEITIEPKMEVVEKAEEIQVEQKNVKMKYASKKRGNIKDENIE
jgi:hypothetical protein